VEHIHHREHHIWLRAPLFNPLHLTNPLWSRKTRYSESFSCSCHPPEVVIPTPDRGSSRLQAFVVPMRLCCFKSRSRDPDFTLYVRSTDRIPSFHFPHYALYLLPLSQDLLALETRPGGKWLDNTNCLHQTPTLLPLPLRS
jgi:hypothetical protein